MAYKPDKHGRDHCPGGEDPIPCLAGDFAWIRLKNITTPQTITGGEVVIYQEVVNDYPEIFDTSDIFGTNAAVVPLVDGLYQVLARQYWDDYPTDGYELNINGVDVDEWTYYSRWCGSLDENKSSAGYSEATFRASVVSNAPGPTYLYVAIELHGVDAGPYTISTFGGTYMEVRYLGSATMNGRLADEV